MAKNHRVRETPKPKNVMNVVHDPKTNELHVMFGNGSIYTYQGVTAKQHDEMTKSPSMGTYLHANIKPKHNFIKKK